MPVFISEVLEAEDKSRFFMGSGTAIVVVHPNSKPMGLKRSKDFKKLFTKSYKPYLERLSNYLSANPHLPRLYLLGEPLFKLEDSPQKTLEFSKLYKKTFSRYPRLFPRESDLVIATTPSHGTRFSWHVLNWAKLDEALKPAGIAKLNLVGEFMPYIDIDGRKEKGCVTALYDFFKKDYKTKILKKYAYP